MGQEGGSGTLCSAVECRPYVLSAGAMGTGILKRKESQGMGMHRALTFQPEGVVELQCKEKKVNDT